MQKYFITKEEMKNKCITSSDCNHIKNVMRFTKGDLVIVSDGETEFEAKLLEVLKNSVSFTLVKEIKNNNELPYFVDIYQGYPKGDKMSDIAKHSTELGISSLYGVLTKRSVVKLETDKAQNKTERFNKIMKEASEQSNRKVLAKFGGIYKLKDIDFSKYDYKILCFEESAKEGELKNFKTIISSIKNGERLAIFIGPEGGIDLDEVSYLKDLGFIEAALGPRILRTETASLYCLSSISYESELKK